MPFRGACISLLFSGTEGEPSQCVVVSDVPAVIHGATVYIEQIRFFHIVGGFESFNFQLCAFPCVPCEF